MKNVIFASVIISVLLACNDYNSETTKSVEEIEFEKSFKEDKGDSYSEHLDTVNNIYSNFKFDVAFDAPDNWQTDSGVSEHNIFRAYQADSAITFSVNVIETKADPGRKKDMDIWQVYQEEQEEMNSFLQLIEEQLNTKIENVTAKKTFLRSHTALRRSFEYIVREFDLEYYNTSIMYQTLEQRPETNLHYTFTLNIPTIIYNESPDYFEGLFGNVYFLKNKERLNGIFNSK